MRLLRVWFSNLVFKLKCRAGFRLLEPGITITGIVMGIEENSDGDFSFDLRPDANCRWVLEYPGNYLGSETIHCEVMPRDRERLRVETGRLAVGVKLLVKGQRAWDGAHYGKSGLVDVLCTLLGAGPSLAGWVEIHPVDYLTVLP